jgi:hypothetical protein
LALRRPWRAEDAVHSASLLRHHRAGGVEQLEVEVGAVVVADADDAVLGAGVELDGPRAVLPLAKLGHVRVVRLDEAAVRRRVRRALQQRAHLLLPAILGRCRGHEHADHADRHRRLRRARGTPLPHNALLCWVRPQIPRRRPPVGRPMTTSRGAPVRVVTGRVAGRAAPPSRSHDSHARAPRPPYGRRGATSHLTRRRRPRSQRGAGGSPAAPPRQRRPREAVGRSCRAARIAPRRRPPPRYARGYATRCADAGCGMPTGGLGGWSGGCLSPGREIAPPPPGAPCSDSSAESRRPTP